MGFYTGFPRKRSSFTNKLKIQISSNDRLDSFLFETQISTDTWGCRDKGVVHEVTLCVPMFLHSMDSLRQTCMPSSLGKNGLNCSQWV